MGHTGAPSHLIPKSPKVWSTGGMPRRMNIVLGPLTLALIILTLFVILSLLILDLTFLWHPKLTLESGVARQLDKYAILSPGCDLFTGSWVYDETYPLYSNCTFVEQGFRCSENGRPDLQYRKWRWQPSNCIMPRFNAGDMLTRLKNQRVAFIGDSMGRTQWESLVCLLMNGAEDKSLVKEIHGKPITKTTPYLAVWFPGFNVTVEYYRSPWLVSLGRPLKHAPRRVWATLKLDTLELASTRWQTANVLVFNSGHWWTTTKTYRSSCYFQIGSSIRLGMKVEEAYRTAIATWAAWVNEQINPDVAHVFFRSFEPSHWRKMTCLNSSSPVTNKTVVEPIRHYMQADALDDIWDTLQVRANFLNITSLSTLRPDGHIFKYSRGGPPMDCAHWCLPGVPDTWNELLYASLLMKFTGTGSVY